jgi:hypothetical protein
MSYSQLDTELIFNMYTRIKNSDPIKQMIFDNYIKDTIIESEDQSTQQSTQHPMQLNKKRKISN